MDIETKFQINDRVCFAGSPEDRGTVMGFVTDSAAPAGKSHSGFNTGTRPALVGRVRYAVKWDDGSEDLFFENELSTF